MDLTDPTLAVRRADIDAKQAILSRLLAELQCEAVVLLMPAHVAWFTGGMNVRGLIADGERPGIYTNGRQRWLLCSNTDTQRLFDEELDGLGFMLKEWHWASGRATLLGELVVNKKVASDRPYPTMPLINDKLRPILRPLMPSDIGRFRELGLVVAHALEATAREIERGETEEDVAGALAHRIFHRGAEAHAISVTAEGRGGIFRRAGYTRTKVETLCTLQATAGRDGLFATASRTVCFGPPTEAYRAEYDAACRVAAVDRLESHPGGTVASAVDTASALLKNTPFEHEWRLSPAGYGTGWFPADDLRKAGVDEKFVADQAIVWQARVGAAGIVDTVLVGEGVCDAITPPEQWPFKRISLLDAAHHIPDLLVL